jgi:hypothetical protein
MAQSVQDQRTAACHYRRALEIAVKVHRPSDTAPPGTGEFDLIIGVATLLARAGRELAVELATLARDHPSSTEQAQDRAQRLLDVLQPELPPVVFVTAQARGRARDLWDTMEELLTELAD